MLLHTFCHIPGIGCGTERKFWDAGVCQWDDLLGRDPAGLSPAQLIRARDHVRKSLSRLAAGEAAYFGTLLPSSEQWRLFPQFRDAIAYLDIETTGLSAGHDHITTIALYDGRSVRHYVYEINLDQFARDIRDYRVLVTYNGRCFDVPFIERSLGIRLPQAHIDLRYVLKSLGYAGGLKGCENQLGLARGDTADIDGFLAVLLWRMYERDGDEKALETLLAYNVQDVLTLELLLTIAYNGKLKATPFLEMLMQADPVPAANPFRADRAVVERLRMC